MLILYKEAIIVSKQPKWEKIEGKEKIFAQRFVFVFYFYHICSNKSFFDHPNKLNMRKIFLIIATTCGHSVAENAQRSMIARTSVAARNLSRP